MIHELDMPPVLRRGGIGTHWLLPGRLSFTEPEQGEERVTLQADDVKRLVLDLHDVNRDSPFDDPEGAGKVQGWMRQGSEPTHRQTWEALLAALSNTGLPAPCAPLQ